MNEPTLLIVDDEQAIIAMFSRRLEKQFGKIVTAVSGEIALDILKDVAIDVLITDMNMPGIDGCELITRAMQLQPMLQAIVITGYGANKVSISAMSAGASSCLQKPINLSELQIAVEQCLEKSNLLHDLQNKQNQLSAYRDHLEELVAKRTLDLTEVNHKLQKEVGERRILEISLRESTKQAENANRVQSEFLANMNHEIRTPMTSSIGLLNLVLETELLPKQKKYLDMARISTLTVHNLLNDILDYSKIEAGRLNLESVAFSPTAVIESVLDLQHLHAKEKAVTLSSCCDDDVPDSVIGDPNRLRQVILNLVSNAIKATHYGEISIKCKLAVEQGQNFHPSEQRPVTLQIVVKDSGVGIADDKMKQIVEVFSQEDSSKPQQPGGIGLGLNICSKLVSAMGGHIWVESLPEQGATFQFTSRFQYNSINQKTKKVAKLNEPTKILVAEDDHATLCVMHDLLDYEGYTVSLASDGIKALQKITEQNFDMVFLDLNMPGMNGYEVALQVRSLEREADQQTGKHISIVAITGSTDKSDQQKCMDAGMDGFLAKPFTRDQLVAKTKEYLPERVLSTHSTLEGETFNETIALGNVSGNRDLLTEQMRDFLQDVPRCLQSLGRAVAGKDAILLEKEIQELKSLAIKMGAINFGDALFSLLMELRKKHVVNDDVYQQIDNLEAEFSTFKKAVNSRYA